MSETQAPSVIQAGTSAVPTSFRCTWAPGGLGAAWIYLAGELDLPATTRFGEMMDEAQSSSRMVLVDLRELEFIDCAGLGIMVRANAYAREAGKSLVLLRSSGQVDRIFELTGLLRDFEFVELGVLGPAIGPSLGAGLTPARLAA